MWTAEHESFLILQMQRCGKIKLKKYGNEICNFNESLFCLIIAIFVQQSHLIHLNCNFSSITPFLDCCVLGSNVKQSIRLSDPNVNNILFLSSILSDTCMTIWYKCYFDKGKSFKVAGLVVSVCFKLNKQFYAVMYHLVEVKSPSKHDQLKIFNLCSTGWCKRFINFFIYSIF